MKRGNGGFGRVIIISTLHLHSHVFQHKIFILFLRNKGRNGKKTTAIVITSSLTFTEPYTIIYSVLVCVVFHFPFRNALSACLILTNARFLKSLPPMLFLARFPFHHRQKRRKKKKIKRKKRWWEENKKIIVCSGKNSVFFFAVETCDHVIFIQEIDCGSTADISAS